MNDKDFDLYMLLKPFANMVLYEYGLELLGMEENNLQLVLTNSKKFAKGLNNILNRWLNE